VHRPSINTLRSLTEKLSGQNAPDLMNNNSNNICARAASSGLTTLQHCRWIYWWLNNINLSYSKSYLEQRRNMLQPSGDFIRPCHTAYLTMKFTNWLSQEKHFCVKVSKIFINSSYKGKRQHNNGNKTLWALDGRPHTCLTPTLHARHTLST